MKILFLPKKLVKKQIRHGSCLKGASDLIGKHKHTKCYGTRQNIFHAKTNSVNKVL